MAPVVIEARGYGFKLMVRPEIGAELPLERLKINN
jgi:hypothetical protein